VTNPPGNRFCGSCGAALGEAAPGAEVAQAEVAERKLVTVLFADLTASTELASELDPEDLRAVLTPFFEAMAEEIGRYGGTVEKFIGDAVVAVFGAPVAHEDDPERAVLAALAMHRRLASLNERFREHSGRDLAMRIGINTGEVVTATGIDRDALVTGEPVNIAARFEALAPPGGIVVGERTHLDARGRFRFASMGEVTVKGIARPLAAWLVEGEATVEPGAPSERSRLAPMVGRQEELSLLGLLFARTVREERAALATVIGPAGIGKSRLSYEFAAQVAGRGAAKVVRGRCLPYGDGLTYWPLADILRSDAGILDNDPPDTVLTKALETVEPRLRPEERGGGVTQVLLSSIGVPVSPDPLAGAEGRAARELIARSWRTYFESIAANPVVAILEDLHWADPSLLSLVEDLAAKVPRAILFLCMTRPELMEARAGWGGGLRASTTITLSPLSPAEGGSLLSHLLEGLPAPAEAIDPVVERSEGNPFYAQELLRMVIESGALARGPNRWALARPLPASLPDTVQGVIASRLDLLPSEQKRVLQAAAVVGRIFWQGAIERLEPSAGGATLAALVEKGLLWERDGSAIAGEREFIFNHILTRDVAYSGIPKARRAEAHTGALRWCEELMTGREDEFAEILAYHAQASGDASATARYGMLAGHRSRRVYAAPEAIRWYERALEASSSLPEEEAGRVVAETALALGEAREQLGRFADAQGDYERSLAAARAVADGRLQARALAALAHLHWLQDRFEEGLRVHTEALEAARSSGATEVLPQLLYTAGTLAFGQGRYDVALERQRQALDAALAVGDEAGEAMARHGLCETLFFLGPYEEALAEGRKADELFRRLGQRPMVYHNLYMVAYVLGIQGELEASFAASEESIQGSRDLGNRRDEGFALATGLIRVETGAFGRSIAQLDEAIAIAEEIATPRLELASRGVRMVPVFEARDLEDVDAQAARTAELADRLQTDFYRPRVLAWQAWAAHHCGDEAEWRRLMEASRDLAARSLTESLQQGQVEVLLHEERADADALIAVGRRMTALGTRESLVYGRGWGRYALALGAALRGRWDEALNEASEVLDAVGSTELRMVRWRALRVRALALTAFRRFADAEVAWARATSDLEACAASLASDEPRRASFLARPDVSEVLRPGTASRLFVGLSDEEQERLWALAVSEDHPEGSVLFRRGDDGSDLYVVAAGTVRIARGHGRPDELTVATIEPRGFFGELALLDGERRSADAVTDGGCTVLRLPGEEFLRLVEQRPRVADRLVAVLSERLQHSSAMAADAGLADVPARFVRAVERVANREGGSGVIEILPVFVRDGAIWRLRPASGGSMRAAAGGSHPGDEVVKALADYGIDARLVHPTSWRRENQKLVITYLAVVEGGAPEAELDAVPVGRSELARGSATGPPPSIEVDHVVEHALRHLSWLSKDDPVVRQSLDGAWKALLDAYEPEPFRSLGGVREAAGRAS